MKTKILLPAIALVVTSVAAFGTMSTFAQSSVQDPHASIIQKLVHKFNLNEDEVKAVFEEERVAMQTKMQAQFEEKLNQAVTDGKLTEEQKKLILAKHEELKQQRETMMKEMKNLTDEERRAKMEEHRASLEAWAEENDIDMEYLMFKVKIKGGPGHMILK